SVALPPVRRASDAAVNIAAENLVGVIPVDDREATIASGRVQPRFFTRESLTSVVLSPTEQNSVLGRMLTEIFHRQGLKPEVAGKEDIAATSRVGRVEHT